MFCCNAALAPNHSGNARAFLFLKQFDKIRDKISPVLLHPTAANRIFHDGPPSLQVQLGAAPCFVGFNGFG